jgi:D-3-phosphoglycerate dehydrogenase
MMNTVKNKYKVLVVASKFSNASPEPILMMNKNGLNVVEKEYGPGGLNLKRKEFCRLVRDVDVLIASALEEIPYQVLSSGRKLKMVALRSAGYDKIDLEAATKLGILVTHNPGSNRHAVADMAIGLMLSTSRRITWMHRGMRAGKYTELRIKSKDLTNSVVGIIGLGRIGKETAIRAKGFTKKIIYHDLIDYRKFAQRNNLKKVPLAQLLKKSDFISIHLPLDETTKGIIGKKELSFMKKSAVLVNTARGGLVNEKAIYYALKNDEIFGYGVDVYEEEPPKFIELLKLDSVVATPHMAGVSEKAMQNMAMETAKKVISYMINNKRPKNILNSAVLKDNKV